MDSLEIEITKYGEFLDLIDCLSIYEGNAIPEETLTQEQILFEME